MKGRNTASRRDECYPCTLYVAGTFILLCNIQDVSSGKPLNSEDTS